MNAMRSLDIVEENKVSPRLAAPKSLAPLASKSKATLPTLNMAGAGSNILESKLSHIPNVDSSQDLEFESAKTLLPKDGKVDEI